MSYSMKQFMQQDVFKNISDIVSFYECSLECHSYCCKILKIEVDNHERKILRKASKEKIEIFERIKQGNKYIYKSPSPCPFLNEKEKCSAYNRRPFLCKIYPFNLSEVIPGQIILYPCLMGVAILNDFINYKEKQLNLESVIEKKDVVEKNNSVFNDFKESSKVYYDKEAVDSSIGTIMFMPNDIVGFKEYLLQTKR